MCVSNLVNIIQFQMYIFSLALMGYTETLISKLKRWMGMRVLSRFMIYLSYFFVFVSNSFVIRIPELLNIIWSIYKFHLFSVVQQFCFLYFMKLWMDMNSYYQYISIILNRWMYKLRLSLVVDWYFTWELPW